MGAALQNLPTPRDEGARRAGRPKRGVGNKHKFEYKLLEVVVIWSLSRGRGQGLKGYSRTGGVRRRGGDDCCNSDDDKRGKVDWSASPRARERVGRRRERLGSPEEGSGSSGRHCRSSGAHLGALEMVFWSGVVDSLGSFVESHKKSFFIAT